MISFGIDNMYRRWYAALVAKPDIDDGYTERHHILPRCMGGGNEPENLVRLSYHRHFRAHWLLTKFTEGQAQRKMMSALSQMRMGRPLTPRQYAISRRAALEAMKGTKLSEEQKAKLRKPKSAEARARMRGVRRSPEARARMSLARIGRPRMGYTVSAETKMKISNALVGRMPSPAQLSEDVKVKLSLATKGRYWCTDGTNDQFIRGETPEGWWPGRTSGRGDYFSRANMW